jgi:ribosomal protein L16 Arg81 hydroxylase
MLDVDYLLAPLKREQFLSEHWETKPLRISRNQSDYYASLVSGSDIDYMVSVASSFESDTVEVLGNTKPITGSQKRMPSAFYNAYREGASLRVRRVNRLSKPLWTLCVSLQEFFGFQVSANLYVTPANSHGLERHYDRHDTIILQIAGSKKWRVSGSPIELPLQHAPLLEFEHAGNDLRYRGAPLMQEVLEKFPDDNPLDEFELQQGDLLYLPRGFVHQAWSTDSLSAHVTLGVYAITWVDLLTVAIGQLAHKDVRFRKTLPVGFAKRATDDSTADHFRDLLEVIMKDAEVSKAIEEINGSLIWNEQSIGEGSITDGKVESIDKDTKVERRPGLQCRFVVDGDFVRLAAAHGDLSLPKFFEPAIRYVSENSRFTVGSLPGGLSENSKVTLVRRLIDDGFLRPERNSH